MDIEKVLGEKLDAIRARYRKLTGTDLHDASLWYYGDEGWTVFLTAAPPRLTSGCASRIAFADIDARGAEVVDELVRKITRKPTAAEIAAKTGLSEDELCEIVCAAKQQEAA